jgi:hypothetical protein
VTVGSGNQAGYAVVAAAFVTGLWAWISQKAKAKDDGEKEEVTIERSDTQSLIQNYQEFNQQLQNRVGTLTSEVSNLWVSFNVLQTTLKESDRLRIESLQQIIVLESQVKILTQRADDCDKTNKNLEMENSRLYRMLIDRNIDIKKGDGN